MINEEPEVVWEDPPSTARPARVNRRLALLQVVSHPGSWARLGEWDKQATANQTACDVRGGRALKDHPPGEFEATAGPLGEGKWGVWARFLPTEPPSTNGKTPH